MNEIQLLTLNVRGLNNREQFDQLLAKIEPNAGSKSKLAINCDAYFLQETKLDKPTADLYSQQHTRCYVPHPK